MTHVQWLAELDMSNVAQVGGKNASLGEMLWRLRMARADEAVRILVAQAIERAQGAGGKVGLYGQAPSDHPAFAEFLVASGIDSISVDPSSFIAVERHVARVEARRATDRPHGRGRTSPRSISHG